MKSEQEIKNWIEELTAVVEAETKPTLEGRVAHYAYHLLRRTVEDVVDWPSPVDDLKETVELIQRELDNGVYE